MHTHFFFLWFRRPPSCSGVKRWKKRKKWVVDGFTEASEKPSSNRTYTNTQIRFENFLAIIISGRVEGRRRPNPHLWPPRCCFLVLVFVVVVVVVDCCLTESDFTFKNRLLLSFIVAVVFRSRSHFFHHAFL